MGQEQAGTGPVDEMKVKGVPKIPDKILNILSNCRIEGNTLFLPPEQLDRTTYEAVNKCIEVMGGKWNRKAKGHVFDADPTDLFDTLVLAGEYVDEKKAFQFFPTPREVAEHMCDLAELSLSSNVLEPSCGKGSLADAVYDRGVSGLMGVELNPSMKEFLKDKPYTTMTGVDFLAIASDKGILHPWNRIVMNPPFCRQQDIDHIIAAFGILKPGGILVSIVSESPFFRTNKKSLDFMAFLNDNRAEVEQLPEGAFKESGTMVRTRIIKIRKAA